MIRKLLLCAAPLVLAACSGEPAEKAIVDESVAEEAVAMITANGSPIGDYAATAPDGSVTLTAFNEDGTYVDTEESGAVVAEGTWAVTDGKTCFSPTTEEVAPMCFTETEPAEDGSFTASPDEGDPVAIAPYVAQESDSAE